MQSIQLTDCMENLDTKAFNLKIFSLFPHLLFERNSFGVVFGPRIFRGNERLQAVLQLRREHRNSI